MNDRKYDSEGNAFISSDYCNECGGVGWVEIETYLGGAPSQCFECEELHQQELRADRLQDEWKGN